MWNQACQVPVRRTRSAGLLGALLFGPALLAGCQSAGPHQEQAAGRDGVFVHIRSGEEDPHAVLMGLKMATLLAEDHDVLVYFDLQGVEVVLANAPDVEFPTFDSSKVQLAGLIKKGVPLYVCPGCLQAAGKKPADVRPGVKLADKRAFFDFTKGRILTLDY